MNNKDILNKIETENPIEFGGLTKFDRIFENDTIEEVNKIIKNKSDRDIGEYDLITKRNNKLIGWEVKRAQGDVVTSDNLPKRVYSLIKLLNKKKKVASNQLNTYKKLDQKIDIKKRYLILLYKVEDLNICEVYKVKDDAYNLVNIYLNKGEETYSYKSTLANPLANTVHYIRYIILKNTKLRNLKSIRRRNIFKQQIPNNKNSKDILQKLENILYNSIGKIKKEEVIYNFVYTTKERKQWKLNTKEK